MESFAQIVKKELSTNISKPKLCCSISFLYGLIYFSKLENGEFIIRTANVENKNHILDTCKFISSRIKFDYVEKGENIYINQEFLRFSTVVEIKENILKCKDCLSHFLKAVFILRGTANAPEKAHRIEMVFKKKEDADAIFEMISEMSISPKRWTRQGKYVLYLKESEKIEDFLAYIGAKNASFTLMNSEIVKEMRNNANRVTNCDSANINKSLQASQKYIDVINKLIESGKIELLSPQLKEMAFKRIEFKELNLADLGYKFNPPISKSGVYHRLEKIVKFYENSDK